MCSIKLYLVQLHAHSTSGDFSSTYHPQITRGTTQRQVCLFAFFNKSSFVPNLSPFLCFATKPKALLTPQTIAHHIGSQRLYYERYRLWSFGNGGRGSTGQWCSGLRCTLPPLIVDGSGYGMLTLAQGLLGLRLSIQW
jgi:hypothetical protein